jgi:hypothetical protein
VYSKIDEARTRRVGHLCRLSSSVSKVAKKLSAIALSYASPMLPIEGRTPASRRVLPKTTSATHSSLEATTTYLLRMYTALERFFRRIAEECNGGEPQSPSCHRELLDTMARAIPDARPAVICAELREELHEYRASRHRTIHAYGTRLDWSRMAHPVEKLPKLVKTTEAALAAFDKFDDSLCSA